MGWSAEQRRTNSIAAQYGYKTAVMENTVPIAEFQVGEGAIVLTKKGEPIMTGRIDAVEGESLKIGSQWFTSDAFSFRRV